MRFEHDGMTLWYGTLDTPAPDGDVRVDGEGDQAIVTVTIAIQPPSATNSIGVCYRVNEGPSQISAAAFLRHDVVGQSQYFSATLTAFKVGDNVDYIVICRRPGRQVPSAEQAKQCSTSFRITAGNPQPKPADENRVGKSVPGHAQSAPTARSSSNTTSSQPGPYPTISVQHASTLRDAAPFDHAAAKLETRINTITAVISDVNEQSTVRKEVLAAKGDWTAALANIKEKLPEPSFKNIELAHSLAAWSDDNVPVINTVLAAEPSVTNLRGVALRFNLDRLTTLLDPQSVPDAIRGANANEKKRNFAVELRRKLFLAEPTAVLHRMVEDAEIPLATADVRVGVTTFLRNQPDFSIRTTSVYTALKHPEAFKDIAYENRGAVVDHLKTLQRVQAISPVPEAVPVLMKANLTSAFHVTEKPESTFLRAFGPSLGKETARQVYTNAINLHIRNEHALITLRQTMRGTGLAIIDGKQTREERLLGLETVTDQNSVPLNLSTLFGSLDYCECDDCLSVYSPASYFVELLQFLRNNDLSPTDPANPLQPNPNLHAGIAGTSLEKLFRRRPDLGCLELTCENTFTVLPYIDLVNEVMESFVVHLCNYHNDKNNPKQTTLEIFNVDGETSSELFAIPQHVNYEAYCIIKNAFYPFTLPYHQAIDAVRILLNYLGTSRWVLIETFRTAIENCSSFAVTDPEKQELQVIHTAIQDRAVDAEFLGVTQEEHIILTKEAFWPKRYFEITQQTTYSDHQYQQNIGVRPVCEYYGYAVSSCSDMPPGCDEMLSTNEDVNTGKRGLTFVKKQFLPRTGIQYTDLLDLIKTQFVNPNFPRGNALAILESIGLSYRFLQRFVDRTCNDPKIRFAKLIAFLEEYQPFLPVLNAQLHPDPCKKQTKYSCTDVEDLRKWVYCYFDRIGRLIVLDSGEGPQLPIEGDLYKYLYDIEPIGTLRKDGTIANKNGSVIGIVSIAGEVVDKSDQPFLHSIGASQLFICVGKPPTLDVIGAMFARSVPQGSVDYIVDYHAGEKPVSWLPARDTCNLDKVRLSHLDGTPLTCEQYDRMQRFIRLWRKLGWTMDETDKALIGLAAPPALSTVPAACEYIDFASFRRAGTKISLDCECGSVQSWSCLDTPQVDCDITSAFFHQLVAVRKLLDSTGLPLPNLLAFWADIGTAGEKSLYAKLFLTDNLVAIDSVFQADGNGYYLTQSATISDHIPVLMAALKLKADDIAALAQIKTAPGATALPDALTLPNVSFLYRYSLLAKILHVRAPLLQDVADLFGDPFKSAWDTLALLETWGKMEDAGFTFRQLDYLILGRDDALRPVGPSAKTTLQLTKTLYDGLNAIDQNHPDITHAEEATSDLIRGKTGLLFEQPVVEQITGLLEGTSVYTASGLPALTINTPDTDPLSKKLKYIGPKDPSFRTGSIQITGRLIDPGEVNGAKGLTTDPGWANAIDCAGKQSVLFFNDVLFGIFTDQAGARTTLLAGDFGDPTDPTDLTKNSAPGKRLYFLQNFLPFLREQLAQRLIVDTLSGAAGLPADLTNVLLSEILQGNTPGEFAMKALQNIKNQPPGVPSGWRGYLIPSANAVFIFVISGDTQPADLIIGGQFVPLSHEDDPSNVCSGEPKRWASDPINLKSGTLYLLEVADRTIDKLQWKTAVSPLAPIPNSALLPDYSSQGTMDALTKLAKAAIVINGFNLSADEASYFQNHSADFDGFDFNAVTVQRWTRLQAYTELRNNLPRTETRLIDLFQWATKPDAADLGDKIAAVTTWKSNNIARLIAPEHFDLNRPEAFRNEINLVKLRRATVVADKIAVDIDRLFDWAKPGSTFWICHQIAEDIRNAIRARYDEDVWEQVAKPLNDQLREHQKEALIAYLLVQQDLIDWGVIDADGLYEFFLVDVQMDACMETSRIKQAISCVQLFIQRCLLGLEEKTVNGQEVGVPNNVIDRDRWEWMQFYRVWEANRKVFCYPENWIVSELRDDKSAFYKELESELLQKDINTQTVQDALKNYLIKVDEVGNLKVVGLFLDEVGNKLHVFARTRNAPYFFFYRYFQTDEKNWYPWEKVQVDIPSYELEFDGAILGNGAYLIPVAFNQRLLIFFPQFLKKSKPNKINAGKKFNDLGDTSPADNNPIEYWEIKMCWSEYRNGKWTQRRQSADALYDYPTSSYLGFFLALYEFVPRLLTSSGGATHAIGVDCFRNPDWIAGGGNAAAVGSFYFEGSQIRASQSNLVTSDPTNRATDFHYLWAQEWPPQPVAIYSFQAKNSDAPPLFGQQPWFNTYDSSSTVQYDSIEHLPTGSSGVQLDFYHPFVHDLIGDMGSGTLDALFDYYRSYYNEQDPQTQSNKRADVYGSYINDKGAPSFNELKRAYSIYNWEATFHAPMLLVDRLMKANQFEQALKMCHFILTPFAQGDPGDDRRFWMFPPFKEIKSDDVLQNLFLGLHPGQSDSQVNEWRNKPFQPHVVARGRPFAYMMWVSMTYIKILIAWGDYLFKQDTIETINQATQLYVLAAHVYGPRGQKIPKRGKALPETYNSLRDKWDAFGNAMVELELAFPFSNQTPFPIGVSNGVVGLANVFGFATTLYFCIPDNPNLKALRDTIDDRLFKIRHCENIAGVFQQLPLFDAPIDPGLLMQATAQGLSIASVLNDLNSPMPNYRFYFLLQKALEVCNELKALGGAVLSAKEKSDGEALARLRAGHESAIQNVVMELRKQQVDESQRSLDALQQQRLGPVNRMQHYVQLIGEDLNKVPGDTTDFEGLTDVIEPSVVESGLKVNSFEKEEMDRAEAAKVMQIGIGAAETLASVMNIIPNFSAQAEPFGCGVTISFGGSNLGAAFEAMAKTLQISSNDLSYQSTNASRKSGFLRQFQDRVLQANIAGFEIKNIDKQILTQQIRINIANQEVTNQQKQIDNAKEVEDFLRNKYTNQELYAWMEGEVRTLYRQAYTLAYDLAKKAERAFRFERGLTTADATPNFIQYGYWDPAYDGLLAGERLYIGLKQLEAAYQEKRGYDFEIVKNISLQQLNPLALIALRETNQCEFALPEVLFDMGYPGHYMRRIKSVALTFACIVGPPTSVNCVLRLLEHKFRTVSTAMGKNDYAERTDGSEDRFSTVSVPITSIAVSTGQNDSGVFELNFRDERYIPFEGAGAISKWRIELPDTFREFEYDSITDVVMHLRYTALDGGDKLRSVAAEWVKDYVKSVDELSQDEGLFSFFDLRHDFPNEWYKATNPTQGATVRVMTLGDIYQRLPFFTKGTPPAKILATNVYLFSSSALSASKIALVQGSDSNSQSFSDGPAVRTMKSFLATDVGPMSGWQLTIDDIATPLDQLWLVARYTLG
jgi:Tc toxin complex TcA C-terminal TcB-binding domain/ABC toxin N-terminal region/Neuraminidase-like domain